MDGIRSPVHDIVNSLWRALQALGATVKPRDAERWGFAIHAALSAAGREFHNHDHVIEILADAGPIESVAALYHDAVYIQVDQGPPKAMQQELAGLFDIAAGTYGGWRLREDASALTPEVLQIFGRKAGDVLTPSTGLNELASAMVAWRHLHNVVTRAQIISIVAAIEQTIPFRAAPVEPLRARLQIVLGPNVTTHEIDDIVKCAVRVGNLDVANFSSASTAEFLENTWKLLPESNPSLHSPMVYSVVDYRIALHRMEEFLSQLDPARVFHSWQDEPAAATLALLRQRASNNLQISVNYLRAKLFAVAFIEAIAEATGGDVPLDYFMGGIKSLLRPHVRRIESFFPVHAVPYKLSPVGELLIHGRASDSSFDIAPSPVAGFLYATLGEAEMQRGFLLARDMWANRISAAAFLRSFAVASAAIAQAASHLLDTRRPELQTLARELLP
ncbi:MAG: hypothetical protein KBG15_13460 [Kofleriaceae bacterium]|nr:hypothetical protein [Kofleriaceae bacterium]